MSGNTGFASGRAWPSLRRTIPLLALSALLSSSCSVATAQTWQCNAPEGTFAEHDIAVPRGTIEFSGEMMIRKANGLSQWNPTAKVAFTDPRLYASECHCNGVVATWQRENPDSFLISLSADGKETPLGPAPYDKPVIFKINFTWDGVLTLEVGNRVVTSRVPSQMRDNLHLSCSTADVDFTIAVAPPPKRTPERCPFAAQEQWTQEDLDRYCKVGG